MKQLNSVIEDLARGNKSSLDSFFHVIETDVAVGATSAKCHFHCINLDGNGRPRVDALVKHLLGHLIDYTVPRKRIEEAYLEQKETGSTYSSAALFIEALGLFSRLTKSGEGGELILFLMAERFLKLPQLVCKMNLKTSTEMHFHGADGLHVGVDSAKGKLCLYWGESKLYADPISAVTKCMKSLAPLLLGTGGIGSPEERDLQLLGQYLDVNDDELETALKNFLDPDDPNFNLLEFGGLCLVGFDSEEYPGEPNSKTIVQVKTALTNQLADWQAHVAKRLNEEKINTFLIHVFLLPFPSVDKFRQAFKAALSPKI
ncbi:MAG: DUF1837 domain-containing protein [Ferribacterium limneticum]